MLHTMNVERLVAFHADKVVPVSLMVPKEKVLCNASPRDIPPIRQALLHRAQCRMLVQLIINIIGLKEAQHFVPQPATFNSSISICIYVLAVNLGNFRLWERELANGVPRFLVFPNHSPD